MALKLYFDFLSQPSRALYILLKNSKTPFEACPVALRNGEHLSDEYKQNVSRFQKVPVIKDGNFTLTESVAILRYLAAEKKISDNFYPNDSKKQARIDEYLEWQHNNIRTTCSLFFRIKWMQPLITGEPADPKRVASYQKRMAKNLDELEELWIQNNAYIGGDFLSAADIWAACELEQPRLAGYDPAVGRPALEKWLNNVREKLGPSYVEAHAILNKIVAKSVGLKSKI